jgi:hypothetical protein
MEIIMKEEKEFPHCPLCDSEMSPSVMDGSWFCYGPSMSGRCPKLPELEVAFKKNATEETKQNGFYINPFQWQAVATTETVILTTTRSGSQTNIKLERKDRGDLSSKHAIEQIPLLVLEYWTEQK